MPLWFRVIRIWLPIVVAASVVMALALVGVQQSYRNSLDDPQLQLATDAAMRLNEGATPESVVTSPATDAETSLAPFVNVFDDGDSPLAVGGTLAGITAKPPKGVLAEARTHGSDRVTWQPRVDVRIASVSVATRDGRVVVSGRNMRAVEERIDELAEIVAIAWGVMVTLTLVACAGVEWFGLRLASKS